MERLLPANEAWQHFWNWIQEPERWAALDEKARSSLYKANQASKLPEEDPKRLMPRRMARLFRDYGRGLYEFRGMVIVRDEIEQL
jgi:DNA-binding ferritin-like protein